MEKQKPVQVNKGKKGKKKQNKQQLEKFQKLPRLPPKEKKIEVKAPNVSNPNLKNAIAVEALFDYQSLNLAYAAWYAFLANKGMMVVSTEDGNNPEEIVGGLGFMMQAMASGFNNGVLKVSKAPEVVIDLMTALSGKTVTFMSYGELSFVWNDDISWSTNPIINCLGGVWQPLVVDTDSGQYDSPASVPSAIYNEENYTKFLNKIAGVIKTPKWALRDPSKYKSCLSRDVSGYARVYIYNGLQPSKGGGYYKDVENEVTITAPMLSSFARYQEGISEARVPTKLHAYAGDAALAAGWPLHPTFISYFNKRSPSFKCIDFDWICYFLGQWMVEGIIQGQNTGLWKDGTQIEMSFQDFRIVLRQALLNVFDSQYMLQFTGPLSFNAQENGFVPFQVNGNSYGAQCFSTMTVPELLQENLAALKARTIRTNSTGKSKINTQTYFPILGLYEQDVPPIPTYKGTDGVSYTLFQERNQQKINLVNGNLSPSEYVNFNSTYYQTALSAWSDAVSKLKAVLASTTSIVGDHGPMGLGALFYTSVVNTASLTRRAAAPVKVYKSPFLNYILNNEVRSEVEIQNAKSMSKSDSKKNVKALPPASIITESQAFTTSALPVNSEMQAFLDSIIVPVIRVDPNGNADQISIQMYQVETKEAISTKGMPFLNNGGGGIMARLGKMAIMCTTGIGHDSAGEYDRVLKELKAHNSAGMLAGLLGGLAKTFLPPDAHGIVDTVADILPF